MVKQAEQLGVRDIIADTSGCLQDNLRTPLGWSPVTCRRHVPIVYSLHDPRGLTSSRIRLSHQSILFHNRVLIALCLQSPLTLGGKVAVGAAIGIGEEAIKEKGKVQNEEALDALFNKTIQYLVINSYISTIIKLYAQQLEGKTLQPLQGAKLLAVLDSVRRNRNQI